MLQHMKTAAKLAVRSKGYDLVRTPTLHGFLASRSVDLVIDVGANKGDYGALLRRYGYKGRILSVEPTSGPYGQLVNRINGDASWRPLNVALGAEPGRAEINISETSYFNSFLPASDLADSFDPKMRIVATESVEIAALDSLIQDHPHSVAFLKIDVQGFEKQVLEGAAETLKHCAGVQLELPIGHLYEGSWSYSEALAYMDRLGFVLAQSVPTNTFTDDTASAIEFDCIFRRKRAGD